MTARSLLAILIIVGFYLQGCQPEAVKNPEFTKRFLKIYGGADGQSASECIQLKDGGYAVIGTITASDQQQAYLVATEANGDVRWTRTIGSGLFTKGMSMELEPNGDILIACQQTAPTGVTSSLLLTYSPDGSLKSSVDVRRSGSGNLDYAVQRVRRAADGGLCFAGTTNDTVGTGFTGALDTTQFLIFKTNATGLVTHTFARGFTGVDIGMTATQATDGSVFMIGSSRLKPIAGQFQNDMVFIKAALQGDGTIGSNNAPTKSDNQVNPTNPKVELSDARDMVVMSPNEVVIAGNTGDNEIYISRINPLATSNNNLGFIQLPIPGECEVNSIMPTPDGGYILAATGRGNGQGNSGENMLLIKTNRQGVLSWFRAFGGDRDDKGKMAIATPDGGYLLTGTLGFEGIPMICLIKTDQNGFIE